MISRLLKKLQDLWSKEWLIKFISLCLAVLLWYFVGGEDVVEKNITVPIEVINLPSDLIISNKYKRDVDVTVRGPRSLIGEMNKSQEARQIDLSKAAPGTRVEEISVSSIPISRGVEVLRVQPSSIILSLDKLIKKEIPINAVTTGTVMLGYVLEDLQIDPRTISITGPQTILSRVDVLKTIPININGLNESVQLQIPLELDAIIVDLIGETSVTADLDIGYDTTEKTLAKVPVSVTMAGFLQEVKPKTVSVTVKIPKMIITKNMDFSSLFRVTAVRAADEEDRRRLKVQVIPAPELTVPLEIVAIEPAYVTLEGEPPWPEEAQNEVRVENSLEIKK